MKTRGVIGLLVWVTTFASSSSVTAWAAEAPAITTRKPGTLQVCLYAGFAPFAYKEGGLWKGWDVDYLRAFASANRLEFEAVEQPQFEDIWLRPGEGKCDIAASGISDTADRRTAVSSEGCWSTNYYGVVRAFLVRKPDLASLTRVEDLRGKTTIVTRNSSAHLDLCYRMQSAKMSVCKKPDDDRPCPNLDAVARDADPACVAIEYPRGNNETNAASDVLNAKGPGSPFAFGGGYGSIQVLSDQSSELALTWPHCNMGRYDNRIEPYAEPFSFVVSSRQTGLLRALNQFIEKNNTPYVGTPVPDLGCKAPPWTQVPSTNPACH